MNKIFLFLSFFRYSNRNQLKEVAEFEGVSISDYVRNLINEKLEDMYDLKIAEEAHKEYVKSGKKTYSFDEVFK